MPVADHAPSRDVQALYVEFAPGARTAWHTHPVGQVLEVTAGCGWVQVRGEAAQRISAGDVVLIEAGEWHWHGAGASEGMTHLALNVWDEAGSNVSWGEQVSEQEYAAASHPGGEK
jgi:quercetin dioxygenase-like cupin family protein